MRIIIDTNLWISFMLGRKIATMRTLLTHPSLEIYVCRELLMGNMSSSKQKANQSLETKKIFIYSL